MVKKRQRKELQKPTPSSKFQFPAQCGNAGVFQDDFQMNERILPRNSRNKMQSVLGE
uniref:Uncharacterized protein n=1 Tax=Setaria italica TaxID=4555 RepID=K3ZBR0_SETIT